MAEAIVHYPGGEIATVTYDDKITLTGSAGDGITQTRAEDPAGLGHAIAAQTSEPSPADFYRGLERDIERRWIELRDLRLDDGGEILVGHAATYDEYILPGWFGDIREVLRPGALTKTLAEKADVRALLNHNPDKVLGRTAAGTLELKDEKAGLLSKIYPDLTISHSADTVRMIRRGDITQMSYAFRMLKERWTFSGDDSDEPPLRELLEVELFDVSPVTYPANPATDIGIGQRSIEHLMQHAAGGSRQAQRMLERLTRRLSINSEPDKADHSEPGAPHSEPADGAHSQKENAVRRHYARHSRLKIAELWIRARGG